MQIILASAKIMNDKLKSVPDISLSTVSKFLGYAPFINTKVLMARNAARLDSIFFVLLSSIVHYPLEAVYLVIHSHSR